MARHPDGERIDGAGFERKRQPSLGIGGRALTLEHAAGSFHLDVVDPRWRHLPDHTTGPVAMRARIKGELGQLTIQEFIANLQDETKKRTT